MKRAILALAGVACAVGLLLAPAANAATEFGDSCTGDGAVPAETGMNYTLFEISGPEDPQPIASPVSGVVTSWRTTLTDSASVTVPTSLRVLRPSGSGAVQLIGQSSGVVQRGANSFPARIPIQTGDLLGINGSGPVGTLYCKTGTKGKIGIALGADTEGGVFPVKEVEAPVRVPMIVRVEPDVDGDGYGDETQDGCPQSAAFQTACPVVTVGSVTIAGKGSATVLVTTSIPAPVSVSGTIALGKGKPATLSAPAQTVAPGQVAKFALKLPKNVTKALKALPKSKKLTLNVSANATNVLGLVSFSQTSAKLKGEGK